MSCKSLGFTIMRDWTDEPDELVAETLGLVEKSKTSSSSATKLAAEVDPNVTEAEITAQTVLAEPLAKEASIVGKGERDEIRRRLADFKAHQERWTRERADFANSIMGRIKPEAK